MHGPPRVDGEVMIFLAQFVRPVLVNKGGHIDVADHEVQVSVIIQVAVGGAVREARTVEPPGRGYVLEAQVTQVFKGNVGQRECSACYRSTL